MSNNIKSALTFIAVCGMGFICALAGGAEWGTSDTGMITFATFSCAAVGAVVVRN